MAALGLEFGRSAFDGAALLVHMVGVDVAAGLCAPTQVLTAAGYEVRQSGR
ncbi:hypothetical protein ABZ815_16440 [Nonomuraea sp. NPDC047529]|uniref:hypothetical protein n=1 Tax=Nonomuraea sp. NPDC047529 TaxID=3155623 RepID=UPI0033EB0DC4